MDEKNNIHSTFKSLKWWVKVKTIFILYISRKKEKNIMSDHFINYNLDQYNTNEIKNLKDVIADVKEGESIIITVDNNDEYQTDRLYDVLIMNDFEVYTKTGKYNHNLNIIGVKKAKE